MTTRRGFLKLGSLFVPAVAAPAVVYSFLWAPWNPGMIIEELSFKLLSDLHGQLMRAAAAAMQIPEHILRGEARFLAERLGHVE